MDFITMDFETANRQTHSACSLALTIVEDNQIIDEYYSLIKPETWFNQFNTTIHGITETDVESSPKFPGIWNDISNYFTKDQLVVAHNMPFDKRILNGTLNYYKIQEPELKTLCTVQTSRRLLKELPNHKLNTVANYYRIPLNHHHALDDARASAKILIEQTNRFGHDSVATLVK